MSRSSVEWVSRFGSAVVAACALILSGSVWAEEPTTSDLKAEVEELKGRLATLEARLAKQEAASNTPVQRPSTVQLPSGLSGVQISGFVDTSYTYNFNEPNSRTNTLRVFDTRAGDFMINNAELIIAKPVSAEHPVGFRTSLIFGTDAEVIGSVTTGLGRGDDEFDLQEAYAEYLAPIGKGIDLMVGKFIAIPGVEFNESIRNWNFSQTYLSGFGQPTTHTGIRATYLWTTWLSTTLGVNNGWDVVDDTNKAKTVEVSATVTPRERLSFTTIYLVGAEQTSNSHDQRHLVDLVAEYQPLDRLTLRLNADYGFEDGAISQTGGGNASWNGVAVFAKYAIKDWWSVAGRWELFNDQDGVRTGINTSAGSPTGNAIKDLAVMAWTLTNELRLSKYLIARLEYRLDKADSAIFRHHQGFTDYQNTIATEFIATF